MLSISYLIASNLNRGLEITGQSSELPPGALIAYAGVFALIVQLCFLSLGLYNPKLREGFKGVLRRLALGLTFGALLLAGFHNLFLADIIHWQLIPFAAILGGALVGLVRWQVYRKDLLSHKKNRILVLGSGERASIIEKRMRRKVDRQWFTITGYVVMDGDATDQIDSDKKVNVNLDNLVDYAMENDISEIVIAADDRRKILPVDALFTCKLMGISVIEILDFIERESGQLAVNLIYPSWIIYSDGFRPHREPAQEAEWLFHSFLAVLVFALTWPLMLLTVIAIKLEDGWKAPVLYTQDRVGLAGRLFRIAKFRSMRIDAESGGAVWAQKNDDRTTRVGRLIRKYRIDELPQLYNVIRGDMGFVGPRPERPEMIKNLSAEIPYYNQRHCVKPGLTGWAQLKYPYGASFDDSMEKLKYDLYYVKHRSFLLDLNILFQTAEVLLFGKGR
jgi:sugar transferase (PEP-CTERM system associated)